MVSVIQRTRKKRRGRKRPPAGKRHLLVIEHPPGLEDLARQEMKALGRDRIQILATDNQAETALRYQGSPGDLRRLRLSSAIYQVHHFAIPRPKALLGHQHWQQLLTDIEALVNRFPAQTFQSFRVAAAGRFSTVFTRFKSELTAATGLVYDEDEADLQIRIRPAQLHRAGWEVLLRLTPRPLSSRSWRVFNYQGAVNGLVAAAMVKLSRPRRNERILNLMCGSGTLLIERGLAGAAGALVGCDIDLMALGGALLNARAADLASRIYLCQADILQAPLSSVAFDTIMIDPPWGQLVGDQAGAAQLYPALLQTCGRLVKPGGQLLILTHQLNLWEETMSDFAALWRLESSRQIFQGGLHPRIYHYRKTTVR